MAHIKQNPRVTQTQCARQVAVLMDRDQRSVERLIGPLFEWRIIGSLREKRVRPELLKAWQTED